MGSLSFLQGIFPTHGLDPGLPHCRQILYQLSRREAQSIKEKSSRKQIFACFYIKVEVLVSWSCLALRDLMDCSLPGSSLHGILQARILEWVAIPSPGDLLDPRIDPESPALQADSLPSEPPGKPRGCKDKRW